MGFYGTLKMIFYKVSRVCFVFFPCLCFLLLPAARVTSNKHPPHRSRFNAGLACVALIISDAPLTADCAATAEDERQ